jgi:hypothetical protein
MLYSSIINGSVLNASISNITLLNVSYVNASSVNFSLGTIDTLYSSISNISVLNVSVFNVPNLNVSVLNTSLTNVSVLNSFIANVDLLNVSTAMFRDFNVVTANINRIESTSLALTIGRNLNADGLISIGSIYSSNYLYGNTNIASLKTNTIQGDTLTIGSATSVTNILGTSLLSKPTINNPITIGYTVLPTKGQIGYVQTNTFSSVYSPGDSLSCYAPIQYTNLPAGLYAINYYMVGVSPYWGAIALVSGTIGAETTVPKESNYGVSMSNQGGETTFSNSAMIRVDGTMSISIGYLSTVASPISGSIQATRIA